jgi:hypothetical protein
MSTTPLPLGTPAPQGPTSSPRALPVGQVLRCARQDYSEQQYFVYVPSAGAAEARVLVAVHGLKRNAQELARMLASHCETHGVVLVAPLFGEEFQDYQRLGRSGRGPRADIALEAVLDQMVMRTGVSTTRIHLFGHAAGAQFAHRYAMVHPHRVAAAAFAAAGWYTFPNPRARFPYGIRRSRRLPDVRLDPDEFLRVPMTAFVGEEGEGKGTFRRTERVNQEQGRTPLERARNWVDAMRSAAEERAMAPLVTLDVVPSVDNSLSRLMKNGGLGERLTAALFGATPSARNGAHA